MNDPVSYDMRQELGLHDGDAMHAALKSIMSNTSLSRHEKKLRARPILSAAQDDYRKLNKYRAKMVAEKAQLDRKIEVVEDLDQAWSKLEDVVLEPNDASRYHRLSESLSKGEVVFRDADGVTMEWKPPVDPQVFVISQDWAQIVANVDEGEVRLPADACVLEYRFSGRTVVMLCEQEGDNIGGIAFVESKGGNWMSFGSIRDTAWIKHVRALCIVLDAEVATHSVIRQPHALNAKRIKAGKEPLHDYHVVDLSKRSQATKTDGFSTGHQKRLHFCRGHWRHFATHKTWIRWCLKGNPALGFVGKEYRA